jgi:glycerophosphoryl diester phosphodiesterase
MNASQLVGHLFLSRNVAHSVHLNTRSFAKHSALQTFYDEIVDLTDKFAEAYQGRHGLIGPIAVPAAKKTTNIVEFLQAAMTEVEEARYEVCEKTDTPIQNIIDEIVGLYLATLYKLRFLA